MPTLGKENPSPLNVISGRGRWIQVFLKTQLKYQPDQDSQLPIGSQFSTFSGIKIAIKIIAQLMTIGKSIRRNLMKISKVSGKSPE